MNDLLTQPKRGTWQMGDPIAPYIEHTSLRGDETEDDIRRLCEEVSAFGFAGVCVYPPWVALAKDLLDEEMEAIVVTVVGFPDGNTPTEKKVRETRQAIADGADEIDMVINSDLLRQGRFSDVVADIRAVVEAAKGKPVKVIIESHERTEEEIRLAMQAIVAAGAAFGKTCTGKTGGGATTDAIEKMGIAINWAVEIKASGGVRTLRGAMEVLHAGATRIGTSSGPIIMGEIAG